MTVSGSLAGPQPEAAPLPAEGASCPAHGATVVALIGAECTGKSTLAQRLVDGLRESTGAPVEGVAECLRDWCLQQGRVPRADEQAHIAQRQQHAVDAALARVGPGGWVVTDTTPLQTAAYSRVYWSRDDESAAAADWHRRRVHLTLLMGVDLPWVPDGFLRDGPNAQRAVDDALRGLLQRHALPFQTVYGQGGQREAGAWQALISHLPATHPAQNSLKLRACHADPASAGWQKRAEYLPRCDQCDNAACEHRLFRRLIAGRR